MAVTDTLETVFGRGETLNTTQMCCRGMVIFLVALVLIRLSGRRSFGLHMPLDNIIVILLGAILSRAVTGASPFIPVVATCTLIVLMRRLSGHLMAGKSRHAGILLEGRKILLFDNGSFIKKNLKRALVREEDVLHGIRMACNTEDLNMIERVYMERNGEISVICKQNGR